MWRPLHADDVDDAAVAEAEEAKDMALAAAQDRVDKNKTRGVRN